MYTINYNGAPLNHVFYSFDIMLPMSESDFSNNVPECIETIGEVIVVELSVEVNQHVVMLTLCLT